MFTKVERLISSRNLRPKKKEGFLKIISIFSFLGIMLGVAILIIVMSVMNGFRYELVNRILGINSHLTIYSRDDKITSYQEIIDKLLTNKEVKYANPLIESQVMISANNKANGGLVKGINLKDLKNKELISKNILYLL